jgi:hypothetical protein
MYLSGKHPAKTSHDMTYLFYNMPYAHGGVRAEMGSFPKLCACQCVKERKKDQPGSWVDISHMQTVAMMSP